MIKRLVYTCLISVLLLSGCLSDSKYRYKESLDDVKSIQILRIEETEEILFETSDLAILSDIQNLKCRYFWNDPVVTIKGLAVKIYYNSNCYEIISSDCSAYYDGKRLKYGRSYFDRTDFEHLVQQYINENEYQIIP